MEKTYSIPQLRTRLIDIVGTENFSTDSEVLQSYSENPYYPLLAKKRQPEFIVMPREVEEITEIIKVANKLGTPVVPRSSGLDPYGDAIPIFGGIMVDLANMKKTVQVEPSALGGVFARVEPGVTFDMLQAELKKEGVRVLMPARLSSSTTLASSYFNRNVLFSSNRNGYSVDEVILSYEMVLPTAEVLKTGSLTLPNSGGTNPHTRGSDIGRICMGSLGTTGIVTKLTLKLKPLPEVRKPFFLQSEKIEDLLNATKKISRWSTVEIGEETIIMNKNSLASLFANNIHEFGNLMEALPMWTQIICLTGEPEWVDCQERDLMDAAEGTGIKPVPDLPGFEKASMEFSEEFVSPTRIDRAFKYLPFNRVEYYTTHRKIPVFNKEVESIAAERGYSKGLGINIIPLEQARAYFVEYDLYFDLSKPEEAEHVKETYKAAYTHLIRNGATINTPHDHFVAEQLYAQIQIYYENMLKIKKLLDPGDIMHPGKLFV